MIPGMSSKNGRQKRPFFCCSYQFFIKRFSRLTGIPFCGPAHRRKNVANAVLAPQALRRVTPQSKVLETFDQEAVLLLEKHVRGHGVTVLADGEMQMGALGRLR